MENPADAESKGQQLLAEAEKKMNPKGFMGVLNNMLSGSSKLDDALECYERAGHMFKVAKNWDAAGKAFATAATLNSNPKGDKHYLSNAATNFINAANCYRKSNPTEAANCLVRAIEIYTEMGKFSMAAKQHELVAEIYETDVKDIPKAIEHYEQAADYHQTENHAASANKCYLKVAQYAAETENYEKAIATYEQIIESSSKNSTLSLKMTDYYLRTVLCHLCVDTLNAQHAIDKYSERSPAFEASRECKFLKELIENIEEQNSDGFTQAVQNYDVNQRLDEWFTKILLRLKKQINENDLC